MSSSDLCPWPASRIGPQIANQFPAAHPLVEDLSRLDISHPHVTDDSIRPSTAARENRYVGG